jgi:hypothetical protein
MTERGILFSAPMVRALLDGSKTQTRRIVKQNGQSGNAVYTHPIWEVRPTAEPRFARHSHDFWRPGAERAYSALPPCPYGQPGDRLWVRETWADLEQLSEGNFQRQAIYRADDIERYGDEDEFVDVTAPDMRWRPSIHMPRWASRILLEIVAVRVERLQDISREDAIAEGIERVENNYGNGPAYCDYGMANMDDTAEWFNSPIHSYQSLWEAINGAGNWDANPWAWVVEFRRIER